MAEQGKRIQFLQDALSKLARSIKEVSKGLIDLEGSIARITGKTKEFTKAQQEAAQGLNRVGKNIKQTAKDVDNYDKKTKKATTSSKGFFANIGKNLRTIVSFYGAYQVLNLALTAFSELTIGSMKRAIALEKALADLRAVAGLTVNDVAKLKTVVFEVAGVTSLTALEVVELQKQLAKLGSSTKEIENLTRPIALLSQALGEDAGGVAGVLKKTLNQFQATSEEADRFANILTGAVNETALSLNDLGTGLSYVGPLGAQLGVSFEETAALLGILADNGFKASKAGTGLRNFFVAAAKDGRPFNEFLQDVGDRNLDAAESFEVFGKVGASQALILSKNVERYKELSDELQTSNRLFDANAVQMASTEGQLQLLASAYDKFSTNLGNAITQSKIFINLIAILDKEASGLAGAYKILSSATEETKNTTDELINSFRKFSDGDDDPITEIAALGKAIKLVGDEGDFSKTTIDNVYSLLLFYLKQGKDLQEAFAIASEKTGRGQLRLLTTTKELVGLLYNQSKGLDEAFISQEANSESVSRYSREYAGLLSLTREGINVDKEKQTLQTQLNADTLEYSNQLNQLRSKGVLTQEEEESARILEKKIALLTETGKKIGTLSVSETTLAEQRTKAEKEALELLKRKFKEQTDAIQNALEAEIDAINAVTDVELEGSKTAEQSAQIRLKQEKLVQAAYANSLRSVTALKDEFPTFADEIQNATDKYENFTQFTQSAVGKEGITILSDYKKQFEELGKQLADETITLDAYETQSDALEASLISSITTLKSNTDANEELKDMLDKVVVAYLSAKKGAEAYKGEVEETEKTIKALGQTIVIDLSIQEALGMALATTGDIMSNFNDTTLENTKNRLEAEKEAIANRYEVEQDIIKSQLDNQLITESQFRSKQQELRKSQISEENSIDKQIFDSEKKRDRQNATSGYLQALASIIPNLIKSGVGEPIELSLKSILSGALATASYGAELSAIGQRQFYPKKFAEGGVVNGPSHSQGGVPFSVQGQNGYEMEGGEYVINKRATSMHRDLIERINKSGMTRPQAGRVKFAQGGLVSSPINESVDYLKAIAEATTSTAIQTSKPVRAFVTSSDLRTNETERRLRDRNDKI